MIKHTILTIVIVALMISPVHAEDDEFTIPDGNGEVVEYINDTVTKREFYTVKTANDNVFYLIIDKEKSSGNVYFLTDADESDLIEFVKDKDKSQPVREAAVPVETEAPPITEPEPTVEKSPNRAPLLMMVVFIAVAGGGAYWYFKIRKPNPVSGILSLPDDEDEHYEEVINEDEDDLI